MNALVGIRALMNGGQVLFAPKRAAAAPQTAPKVTIASRAVAAKADATAGSAAMPVASGMSASTSSGTTGTGTTAGTMAAGKAATDAATTGTRTVKQELDRDAFLQLLVCQMQNQDPLSPTDNTQMIAQLAQFTSLEQMNNLNASFNTVKTGIDQLNFMSAGAMVGRQIAGTDAAGAAVEGKVERVYLDTVGGGVYLVVGGKPVAMSSVQRIE